MNAELNFTNTPSPRTTLTPESVRKRGLDPGLMREEGRRLRTDPVPVGVAVAYRVCDFTPQADAVPAGGGVGGVGGAGAGGGAVEDCHFACSGALGA